MDDRFPDPEWLALALETTFPDLPPSALRILASGFRSVVVESADGLVFRVGRVPEASAGYGVEAKLLPELASLLPFPIPNPQWYVESTELFPNGVIGYRKMEGRPLQSGEVVGSQLVTQVAEFLAVLHGLDADRLDAEVPRAILSRDHLEELPTQVSPILSSELSESEWARMEEWWESAIEEAPSRHEPRLRHGDFWYENLLVSEGGTSLVGVVDWEWVALGDPAEDFASLHYLGDLVLEQVLRLYSRLGGKVDPDLRQRVERCGGLRELKGLAFALQHEDQAELNDALSKVRKRTIAKGSPKR